MKNPLLNLLQMNNDEHHALVFALSILVIVYGLCLGMRFWMNPAIAEAHSRSRLKRIAFIKNVITAPWMKLINKFRFHRRNRIAIDIYQALIITKAYTHPQCMMDDAFRLADDWLKACVKPTPQKPPQFIQK